MPSQLQSVVEPPTRLRAKIERRSVIEAEFELPAGTDAYALGNSFVVDAGKLGFLSAQDAAARGLIKLIRFIES
jgi:hypothetical protein